jgi:glycine oxidase
VHYPEESHVFAPDYVKALEQACRNLGVIIEENLEEVSIEEWRKDVELKSKDGRFFSAERLVICSGAWAQELEETFAIRIPVYPIRGQICAYDNLHGRVNHIIYTSQGYLVPKGNGTLVNGASEDIAGFATDVTEKGILRLTNWNHNILPFLKELEPFHRWAGLRPATQDGYPLIGALEEAPHVIMATGHYRNGILLSPVTAVSVANLIDRDRELVPLALFKPERFT